MSERKGYLDNVVVVLVGPKYSENVGAAARVALNMGIRHLRLAASEPLDYEKMTACATHNAKEVIENITYWPDLESAVADLNVVVGTTARLGRKRGAPQEVREMALEVVDLLENNRLGVVFGPESRGLSNLELACCTRLTTIATADFASINLAQAVGIVCYELNWAWRQRFAKGEGHPFQPRLATAAERRAMFRDLDGVLDSLNLGGDRAREGVRRQELRRFLAGLPLRAGDTRLLAEYCRLITEAIGRGTLSRP